MDDFHGVLGNQEYSKRQELAYGGCPTSRGFRDVGPFPRLDSLCLISGHAGGTGIRWFRALQDAIESLAEFPERCPVAPESALFPFEVRHLLYGHLPNVYRILFTIAGNTVYVLHIRHGRRQPVKH